MEIVSIIFGTIFGIFVLIPFGLIALAFLIALVAPICILAIPIAIVCAFVALFCKVFHLENPMKEGN